MVPIFRRDPYCSSLSTVIDRIEETPEGSLLFCREALFTEGGGQPADHGALFAADGGEYQLLAIKKVKGNIGYLVQKGNWIKGQPVNCQLDSKRRKQIMRLHTAQHALAGALRLLRGSILTGEMQIDATARVCSVHYPYASACGDRDLSQAEKILAAHIAAKKKVSELQVTSEQEAREKFAALYRPTIASGTLKGTIRLITIEGLDANACGGTHVRSLDEIGSLKITEVREHSEGRVVYFTLDGLA